ncbi:MAG: DUF5123 domain-containing protein [bacterium]|nr:DUF5123 domain-containing protein [bacterium]
MLRKLIVIVTVLICVQSMLQLNSVLAFESGTRSSCLVLPDGNGDYPDIQSALTAAEGGDSVLLADGQFSGAGNRDLSYLGKDLYLGSVSGNPQACVIACDGSTGDPHRGVMFDSNEGDGAILEGITIQGGWSETGGAIHCATSSPVIRRCLLRNNDSNKGGALYCTASASPLIVATRMVANNLVIPVSLGGAIYCEYSDVTLENCTISHNGSNMGGCAFVTNSGFTAHACLFTFSYSSAACFWINPVIAVSCCNVFGNAGGDWVDYITGLNGVDGNICLDPLYCDAAAGDYRLVDDSPCLPDNNDCDETIGALGGCGVTAVSPDEGDPGAARLHRNYPNPFNPVTEFEFTLVRDCRVVVSIHDPAGRLVTVLKSDNLPRGRHRVTWNADRCGAGVYLCRLQAGEDEDIRKCILLK